MGAITLAEIDSVLSSRGHSLFNHSFNSFKQAFSPCPLNSQQIFCSHCGEYNWEKDRLVVFNNGWQVKHGMWFCPQCAPEVK